VSLPQNVNFRSTLAFVTDGANTFCERAVGGVADYPTVTAQGNNVGWESGSGFAGLNGNAANDPRIAGLNVCSVGGVFRIDLPAPGAYPIRIAVGDKQYASATSLQIKDTTTPVGIEITGATSAPQRFKDAEDTELSQTTWPSSNVAENLTFVTTIARFVDNVGGSPLAHISVGAAIPVTTKIIALVVARRLTDRPGEIEFTIEWTLSVRGEVNGTVSLLQDAAFATDAAITAALRAQLAAYVSIATGQSFVASDVRGLSYG